jgi:hypothetical protein
VQEVRELKSKNAELEKQLERGPKPSLTKASPAPPNENLDGLDWAAQKARLLAQLESDCDESVPEEKANKLAIEEVIRRTDEIIAAKDREIAELQRMLDQQSSTLGEVAVGAHAFAQLLDQDEIVRQERANLKRLEEEWRQKVRQAEIDISVERAKLARERTKLEEQIQRMEAERSNLQLGGHSSDGKKSGRGRWLTRLGLTDDDEAT